MTTLFKLTWTDWEMENSYLFTHDNKTGEAFNNDVKWMLVRYGEEYLALAEKEKVWACADAWIHFIAGKLPELGYVEVEPLRAIFTGNYIIEEGNSKSEQHEWKKIVGEKLFNRAIELNKGICDYYNIDMDKVFIGEGDT